MYMTQVNNCCSKSFIPNEQVIGMALLSTITLRPPMDSKRLGDREVQLMRFWSDRTAPLDELVDGSVLCNGL